MSEAPKRENGANGGMVYQGAPVISPNCGSWWTTVGDERRGVGLEGVVGGDTLMRSRTQTQTKVFFVSSEGRRHTRQFWSAVRLEHCAIQDASPRETAKCTRARNNK